MTISEVRMQGSINLKVLGMFLTFLIAAGPEFAPPDSQRFILGPEVLVSLNQDGGDLRCEPSAAIFKETVLIAWNDSYGGRHGAQTGTAIGWAISKDRGRTFQFGGYLPLAQNDFVAAGADSRLAVDAEGNFFLEILSWQAKSKHLQLYMMPGQAGSEWRKLAEPIVYQISKGEEYIDKPAISVSGNHVGIVYTEKLQASGPTISIILSDDRGKTWAKSLQLSAASNRIRSGSAITINKNEIVVAWTESDSANAAEIWFSKSTDGGKSFSEAARIYQLKRPLTPPRAYRMAYGQMADISNDTSLASVGSPSGNATHYLSFVEGTDKGADVLLMSYDPKSRKWSEPMHVAEDNTATVRIHCSMTLIGGRPALLYYERTDASNTATDVKLSLLSDGRHFETVKLNTDSSDWGATKGDLKYAPIQRVFGDYITLATDGNSLVAAWTDGRQGVPRIYARVIGIK